MDSPQGVDILGSRPLIINRRRFVVGAAASLAAISFGAKLVTDQTSGPRSAGYIEQSESLTGLGRGVPWLGSSPLDVIPATSIPASKELGSSLQSIRVLGTYPAVPDSSVESAALDVLFEADGGAARFGAWSYDAVRGCASSNVCFAIPVTSSAPELRLQIRHVDGESTVIRTRLQVSEKKSAQKLKAGYYLLGFRPELWSDRTSIDPRAPAAQHLSLVVGIGV